MSTADYQPRADQWEARGRDPAQLITHDGMLLRLALWIRSPGAKQEGVSDSLRAFCEASIAALGGDAWVRSQKDYRDYCSQCGERWLFTNMVHCTRCYASLCMKCEPFETAPNGNTRHQCGGEMVFS